MKTVKNKPSLKDKILKEISYFIWPDGVTISVRNIMIAVVVMGIIIYII